MVSTEPAPTGHSPVLRDRLGGTVTVPPTQTLGLGRLGRCLVVLWLLSILTLFLVQALSGSPVDVLAGQFACSPPIQGRASLSSTWPATTCRANSPRSSPRWRSGGWTGWNPNGWGEPGGGYLVARAAAPVWG
jgi:hypothetical protein